MSNVAVKSSSLHLQTSLGRSSRKNPNMVIYVMFHVTIRHSKARPAAPFPVSWEGRKLYGSWSYIYSREHLEPPVR